MSLEQVTIESVKQKLKYGIRIEKGNGITQQIAKAAGITMIRGSRGEYVQDSQTRNFLIALSKEISQSGLTPKRKIENRFGFEAAHTVQVGDVIKLDEGEVDKIAATLTKGAKDKPAEAKTADAAKTAEAKPARLNDKTDPRSLNYQQPQTPAATTQAPATTTATATATASTSDLLTIDTAEKQKVQTLIAELESELTSVALNMKYLGGNMMAPERALVKQSDGEFFLWDVPTTIGRNVYRLDASKNIIGMVQVSMNGTEVLKKGVIGKVTYAVPINVNTK